MEPRIRVGISSCLLGQAVRYDGGHKRDRWLTDVLGAHVEWVAVCPELEAGMGVPRPPLRLERAGRRVRLVEIASRRDHTARMQRFAARRLRALRALELCGYVLKQDSPSCGLAAVRLYGRAGAARRAGTGLFAAALRAAWPDLPVEEEGRLQDATLRENFVERVFAYRRLRALLRGRWTRGRLAAFHAAHELQLRAHSPRDAAALARLVAGSERLSRADLRRRYANAFLAAIARVATRASNARALQLAAGHLEDHLDPGARAGLAARIHAYRRGSVPLEVPITSLAAYARTHGVTTLLEQSFLAPHPGPLWQPAREGW